MEEEAKRQEEEAKRQEELAKRQAPFKFRAGRTPLLVSMPHTGTHLQADLKRRLTPVALMMPDTDWHLEELYDFLDPLGASVLVATHSRYVVDLNRPPDNANLYPGQDTTALVPTDTFHKEPLYRRGEEPSASEIAERVAAYWQPYHAKLAEELERLREKYGYALLWDAHSIFSELPRFFSGKLTELNLGTADGRSCGPGIGEALLKKVSGYGAVLNGRFKGGYITRTYGQPAKGVHAVQLELSEATYMNEFPPYRLQPKRVVQLRPQLRALIEEFCRLGPAQRKG
jgi:N-formylglutamate deformylase